MGLTAGLLDKTVFLDTAPLIYFIEGHSIYQDPLFELFKANDEGKLRFATSTLTLLEVLVQPMRLNRSDLVDKYEQILTSSPHLDIYDIDFRIARRAAQLRAKYNLKTPDALQIATCVERKSDVFLTNDVDLKKVTEVAVLTLKEIIDKGPL
ncbi:MAG TPA: hypothetical protein DIW47_01805 [Bacteroidetes bacterium]|nr:hypothetical protein [Bacteroidota bacterium]